MTLSNREEFAAWLDQLVHNSYIGISIDEPITVLNGQVAVLPVMVELTDDDLTKFRAAIGNFRERLHFVGVGIERIDANEVSIEQIATNEVGAIKNGSSQTSQRQPTNQAAGDSPSGVLRKTFVPLSVRRKVTDAIETARPLYRDQTLASAQAEAAIDALDGFMLSLVSDPSKYVFPYPRYDRNRLQEDSN